MFQRVATLKYNSSGCRTNTCTPNYSHKKHSTSCGETCNHASAKPDCMESNMLGCFLLLRTFQQRTQNISKFYCLGGMCANVISALFHYQRLQKQECCWKLCGKLSSAGCVLQHNKLDCSVYKSTWSQSEQKKKINKS